MLIMISRNELFKPSSHSDDLKNIYINEEKIINVREYTGSVLITALRGEYAEELVVTPACWERIGPKIKMVERIPGEINIHEAVEG